MTDKYDTEAPGATASGVPDTDTHRPGEWPPCPYTDPLLIKARQERARREMFLTAVRAHLEEQPSPNCVRDCARNWCTDIRQIAEEVITTMNSTEDAA